MTDELNNNITDSEITTDSVDVVKPTETPKTYSEDEYKKGLQSSASKAKNEILQELGISSVKDFSILKKNYEDSIKITEDLKKSNEDLANKLVLKDLNVKDDVADDFISLAKKRTSQDKDFNTASKEVAELYPTMLNTNIQTSIKLGTEKSESSKPNEGNYSEEMLKRYPYLKNYSKK